MARINSKSGLIKYIRHQLGEPTITVEVTNSQISQIIDDAVQKFTEYAYGTLEGVVIVQLSGAKDYAMPDTITNIIRIVKGAPNNFMNFKAAYGDYVPDFWSEQFFSNTLTGDIIPNILAISVEKTILDKYFGNDLSYNFNHLSKKLQVLEEYSGPALIHYQYEYIANEQNDLVYNHQWIKSYCKAKTKKLWGEITGKYQQTLIGGAQINYDRIIQEAETELEKLEEELLTKWSDPAPIDVA